ncbi:MAG: DUF5069 domain-containing protein [Chthoniobacterales bacterium]|nr:DUF5069 domain-containing protein [Chthoniobacterales bacterium]
MEQKVNGQDLTKVAPRSPKARLGGYVILSRTLDKCRALLAGDIGEYHFDCPLDNMLFGWKGIKGDDFKAEVEKGTDDAGMAQWVDAHGTSKTAVEKESWCKEKLAFNFNDVPEKKEWYAEQLKPLGLDPATTPLFDWLEADDKASYQKAAA